jgi:LytS/YehU family sensor histidine kinase
LDWRVNTRSFVVDARESIARQMTEAARLNEKVSSAQLEALRRQVEPHFMYNTLNSIASLVRDHKGEAAVNMIVGLSEFLRRTAEDSHRSQVPLAEEVEYLQRYLDLQKARFGERQRIRVTAQARRRRRRGSPGDPAFHRGVKWRSLILLEQLQRGGHLLRGAYAEM